MRVDVVTIFPDYLAPLGLSLIGRAREAGLLDLRVHDLRDWTHDRHRTVDDTPYGGGAGMVMRPEPWGEALDALTPAPGGGAGPRLVVPTPAGRRFDQAMAHELAAEPWLLFACGRYEGIDARVVEEAAGSGRVSRVDEVSLGDYVLNGGEVAVLAVVEAVARLLPGVVGNAESLVEESHAASRHGLLEHPVYTKPAAWRGREVPPVLLSGDHGAVARWRRDEALRRTAARRPDLVARLDPAALDRRDLAVLADAGWAPGADGRFGRTSPAVAD
ncbi:tRNA (guanosine(37)-N1)-methyltransferase TrmD [Vallicoccus soli]|uniref:tRNA (guanine-N(1)-)-methyltransferase n=1 Tax=Vallicoccus soli TaxID=2339232 RepID=A0A3A3Z5L7_9ACTN|nr:tRNA (guanosine(37)-N1)-methyltransferase TrmD [Vallicoccus soli]RJK98258.1 tRNA (guanosine(37)-N1)-methyltransferase TrmD [Vallicoccus soli]